MNKFNETVFFKFVEFFIILKGMLLVETTAKTKYLLATWYTEKRPKNTK